jgi:hypothetical protein
MVFNSLFPTVVTQFSVPKEGLKDLKSPVPFGQRKKEISFIWGPKEILSTT